MKIDNLQEIVLFIFVKVGILLGSCISVWFAVTKFNNEAVTVLTLGITLIRCLLAPIVFWIVFYLITMLGELIIEKID